MAYPHQLERFIAGYMESQGALCERPVYGIVEIFAENLRQSGEAPEHLIMAFDYEASQEFEGAEFVSHGHPLYERIAEAAVKKHLCAERFVGVPTQLPSNLEKKLAVLENCQGSIVELLGAKLYLTRVYRFAIKTSFLNEQREENINVVWIDGASGKRIAYDSLSHIFHEDSASSLLLPELGSIPILKLFDAALNELAGVVEVRRKVLEKQNHNLALQDKTRTDQYFQTLLEEANAKLGKAIEPAAERDARAKLESIVAQRLHHLQDIDSRYQVGCEVSLLDLVCYVVPRWKIKFKDKRRGSAKTETGVRITFWDELLKQFI